MISPFTKITIIVRNDPIATRTPKTLIRKFGPWKIQDIPITMVALNIRIDNNISSSFDMDITILKRFYHFLFAYLVSYYPRFGLRKIDGYETIVLWGYYH